jgi:hypothetical protein
VLEKMERAEVNLSLAVALVDDVEFGGESEDRESKGKKRKR